MKIKATLMCAAMAALFTSPAARSAITVNIKPFDESGFTVTATGTGSLTSETTFTGFLYFAQSAFLNEAGGVVTGSLNYGGVSASNIGPYEDDVTLGLALNSNLASGDTYSFSDGPIIIGYRPGLNYETTFIPGTYVVTGSSGVFGDTATGTLTIVPESNMYAALAGVLFLGLALWRRRIA